MTDGWVVRDKMFGVVSFVIVGGGGSSFSPRICSYFSTPGTAFCTFSETDFWIYAVTLYCR